MGYEWGFHTVCFCSAGQYSASVSLLKSVKKRYLVKWWCAVFCFSYGSYNFSWNIWDAWNSEELMKSCEDGGGQSCFASQKLMHLTPDVLNVLVAVCKTSLFRTFPCFKLQTEKTVSFNNHEWMAQHSSELLN